jgi:hemoglobin
MSIYDEIGGSTAVAAVVDSFYERVLADPHLTHYFEGVDVKRLKGHQRGFIAAAIGGAELYTGRSMREAHATLHIRPEHFDLVVGHLVDTMTSLNVPDSIIGQIGAKLTPLRDEIAPTLPDTATLADDASLDAAS